MIKKTLLSLSLAATTLFATAPMAHAQTNNNPFQGLIQAIAQKFGLNQTDVQSVANQFKADHKAQNLQKLQQKENNRLDNLVKQGKLTAIQEQQVKDEIAKLQSEFPTSSEKGMTKAQRKQQMQNMQNEINSWSQSTGIDKKYLLPFGAFGMGMRKGWLKNSPTPTPSA